MNDKQTTLSSTEKALKILLAFAPYNYEMGTLELSKNLGIHKSTVSRLLRLLAAHGFLQQNPDTKKYALGRSVVEIGNAAVKSLSHTIVGIAHPFLNSLSETVGESVALEVLTGTDIVLAGHVEGRHHIRFTFNPGEMVIINVAAGAKAILAFSDPELVRQCMKKKFVRYTKNTIVSKREYRGALETIREAGISYDRGERFEDSYAIAAPIFNSEKKPVAAVVIAGPAFRMTDQYLKEAITPLKKTAREISRRLFY
jgi:IclR family acetate operon transcriptional repressor